MRHSMMLVGGMMLMLLAACGPSAEQVATMTASAWTPTPLPPTATLTPTPIPYDLTVKITDVDGNPLTGSSVVFPGSGNSEPIQTNDAGQITWSNLGGPNGSLTVTSQGYLKGEQSFNLQRGPNDVVVALERDPFGILPSEACAAGETLLYLDDFQDGEAQGWHGDQKNPDSRFVGPAPEADANSVLNFDATKLTPGPDVWLGASYGDGAESIFSDAVWRLRFMVSRPTAPSFTWHVAGASEFDGQEVTNTQYSFNFWGAQPQIHLHRQIFGAAGPLSDEDVVIGTFAQEAMQWHQMELSSFQGHLQVWIDGELEVEYTDSEPLPPGQMGIWLGPFTDPSITVLYFDNMSVCGLSAPFAPMPSPVPAP